MLVFVILGLLLAGCIVAIVYGYNKDYTGLNACGWIFGVLILLSLIKCICDIPKRRDIEYEIAKYEELKREVQQVSKMSEKCDLTVLAKKDLFEDVRKMNNYIDKNKTYYDSWIVGLFYTEKIGNLEKIDYLY